MLVQPLNCVQLGVACGWLSYGLMCKLLFDVFELTNNCMQLTRTHQRYCLGDDCCESSRWSPHNRECSSCWPDKAARSEENSLSSRRRRLDIDEKNHLHCTCPMGRLSILFLFLPDSTFLAARSSTLSALNETPSARARYAIGWQLLAQAIHDDVLKRKGNVRSCCSQWTDAGVGLSKWAVAGHTKQAAALNARRVSTRSTLTLL